MQSLKLKFVTLFTTVLVAYPAFTMTQQVIAKQFHSEQAHTQLQVYTAPFLAKINVNKIILSIIKKLIINHLWETLLIVIICYVIFAKHQES